MGYKNFASMNIAIVGTGRVSEALAQALALAEHEVFLATTRDEDRVSEYILSEYSNIYLATIEYAAAVADIIILATQPGEVREAAYMLDDVRRKVIIDTTPVLAEGENNINTVNAVKAITGSAHVVKCYNHSAYELSPFMVEGEIANEMYMVGDSTKAKEIVKLLARDMELTACNDMGGLDALPELESIARNWQMRAVPQPIIRNRK